MSLSVKVLGCGSALPTTVRNASAQILKHNQKLFLIDCGEYTQVLMRKYGIRFSALKHIFISHLHGDHFYGIFGLLSSLSLMGNTGELHIHCPEKLKYILESENSPLDTTVLGYQLCFDALKPSEVNLAYEDQKIEVYSVPLKHRIQTWGFIFKEKPAELKNIRKECIEKYSLSISEIVRIKEGCDLRLEDGTIIENSELTLEMPPTKSYAYISDTMPSQSVCKAVEGVDVLYHEATYEAALAERASQTFHSTSLQAAEIAKNANVGKLVLGHFSSRYTDTQILENEAKTIFPNTICAYDGLEFEI